MNAGGVPGGQGGQPGGGGGDPVQTTSAPVNAFAAISSFTTSTIPHVTSSTSSATSSTASTSTTASAVPAADHVATSATTIIIGVVLGITFLIAGGFLVAYMNGWMFPCTAKRAAKQAEKRELAKDPSAVVPWYANQNWSRRASVRPGTITTQSIFAPSVVPVQTSGNHTDALDGAIHSTATERIGDASRHSTPEERNSSDYFLPSYTQSQSGRVRRTTLHPLNTSNQAHSEDDVSPLTESPMAEHERGGLALISSQTDGAAFISPQSTGCTGISFFMSPQNTPSPASPLPQQNSVTIGVSSRENELNQRASIVAPIPVYPSVNQRSLERSVMHGMLSPTPDPQDGSGSETWAASSRESGVLGEQNSVRMVGPGPPLSHMAQNNMLRNTSQRTVSSVMSLISDRELDRLGVGSRVASGSSRWVHGPRG